MKANELNILLQVFKELDEKADRTCTDVAVINNNISHMKENIDKNTADLAEHMAGTRANTESIKLEKEAREKLETKVDLHELYIIAAKIRKAKINEICGNVYKIVALIAGIGTIVGLLLRLYGII